MEKVAFELACKSMMAVVRRVDPGLDRCIGPVIEHRPIWDKETVVGSEYVARLVETDGQDDLTLARGTGATEAEAWSNLEGEVAFWVIGEVEREHGDACSDLVSEDRPV